LRVSLQGISEDVSSITLEIEDRKGSIVLFAKYTEGMRTKCGQCDQGVQNVISKKLHIRCQAYKGLKACNIVRSRGIGFETLQVAKAKTKDPRFLFKSSRPYTHNVALR